MFGASSQRHKRQASSRTTCQARPSRSASMPTLRKQNIARTMNLISSMDGSMNEGLLAFVAKADAPGIRIPGGAKGNNLEWHCDPMATAMSQGPNAIFMLR